MKNEEYEDPPQWVTWALVVLVIFISGAVVILESIEAMGWLL